MDKKKYLPLKLDIITYLQVDILTTSLTAVDRFNDGAYFGDEFVNGGIVE